MTRKSDHGLRSVFARTGGQDDRALTQSDREFLAEIKSRLETTEGMIEIMREQAANQILISTYAHQWIQDVAEKEGGAAAFEKPVMKTAFTSFESTRRAIESLHRMTTELDGDGLSAGDILDATRSNWQQTRMEFTADDKQSDE